MMYELQKVINSWIRASHLMLYLTEPQELIRSVFGLPLDVEHDCPRPLSTLDAVGVEVERCYVD